jgi:hypothetical protein
MSLSAIWYTEYTYNDMIVPVHIVVIAFKPVAPIPDQLKSYSNNSKSYYNHIL